MSVFEKRHESPSKNTSWKRVKKPVEAEQDERHGEHGDRERERARPPSRPRGTTAGAAYGRAPSASATIDERGDQLPAQRRAEERAHVLHVRQLALVERRRSVGQRRPLEQDDPLATRAGSTRGP